MVASPVRVADGFSKGTAIQARLAREVLRKLRLAADEAEEKEDRDIICSEVFADITGDLSGAARESTGTLYTKWYEVLAPYFCKTWDASEALLAVCRRLWGQPFTAPIYALLLHQWLLVHKDAGGADQRLKHLNVLVSGTRQLLIGDVETSNSAFHPLYTFMAEQVVLPADKSRLEALPSPGREAIMGLVASFLPYYGTKQELLVAMSNFPSPAAPTEFPAPGSSQPSEGANFLVSRIVDTMSKEIKSEEGLITYLRMVMALQGSPYLSTVPTATRVRLQVWCYMVLFAFLIQSFGH